MAAIKVPKPPKTAFNPNRPASGLLRDQVEHLEWAVRHAGERSKGGRQAYRVKPVHTEADVAARMKSLLPKLTSAAQLPFVNTPIPDDVEVARRPQLKAVRKAKPKPKQKAKGRTTRRVSGRNSARAKK